MKKREVNLFDMGKRIVECRKALGLTQEALAEKADVSAQFISYAESGNRSIRAENLMKLSAALHVSADYLLTGARVDKDQMILLSRASELSPKNLALVSRLIDEILKMQEEEEELFEHQ